MSRWWRRMLDRLYETNRLADDFVGRCGKPLPKEDGIIYLPTAQTCGRVRGHKERKCKP